MSSIEISEVLRGLTLGDLREQCRARGLNPGGGQEALRQRLRDDMDASGDAGLKMLQAAAPTEEDAHFSANNYQRPGGNQNLGNRITGRPSSRVAAPPGGASQISFGDHTPSYETRNAPVTAAAEALLARMGLGDTEQMLSGHAAPPPDKMAAGRSFNVMPNNGQRNGGGEQMHQGLSQVAFGDYQLPSTVGGAPPAPPPHHAAADSVQHDLAAQADAMIKGMTLTDLRTHCRARGLSPAGGVNVLRERLGEHMTASQDMYLEGVNAAPPPAGDVSSYIPGGGVNSAMQGNPGGGPVGNNYARPGGQQNVGNFLSDRPTSRVLAPPGGNTQISFGDHVLPGYTMTPSKAAPEPAPYTAAPSPYAYNPSPVPAPPPARPGGFTAGFSTDDVASGHMSNNYARPGGAQNLGNYITGRNTSRVLAPPGGKTTITFG